MKIANHFILWLDVTPSYISDLRTRINNTLPEGMAEAMSGHQVQCIKFVNSFRFRRHHHPVLSSCISSPSSHIAPGNHRLKLTTHVGYSVWKPLQGPLHDWPLCVCDSSTVDTTDLVPSDQVFPRHAVENIQVHFNEKQKWHYLSGQTAEELWMFQQSPLTITSDGGRLSCGLSPRSVLDFPVLKWAIV